MDERLFFSVRVIGTCRTEGNAASTKSQQGCKRAKAAAAQNLSPVFGCVRTSGESLEATFSSRVTMKESELVQRISGSAPIFVFGVVDFLHFFVGCCRCREGQKRGEHALECTHRGIQL